MPTPSPRSITDTLIAVAPLVLATQSNNPRILALAQLLTAGIAELRKAQSLPPDYEPSDAELDAFIAKVAVRDVAWYKTHDAAGNPIT